MPLNSSYPSIQQMSSLDEAVIRMKRLSVHHLVVFDGKKYVGMLDARDCVGIWDPTRAVKSLMGTEVPLVEENTEIRAVVGIMAHRRLTAVPLMRTGEPSGIVTSTDLLRLLEAHLDERVEISELIEKGKGFLATPLMQSLSKLCGSTEVSLSF